MSKTKDNLIERLEKGKDVLRECWDCGRISHDYQCDTCYDNHGDYDDYKQEHSND